MFALHDLIILDEPKYDASKRNVIRPTDDPQWLEKSDAPVAWDLASLHVHCATALEQSHPEAAAMLGNVKRQCGPHSQPAHSSANRCPMRFESRDKGVR